MSDNEFLGKNVLVVGLGRFGGQIAAARWLVERGANVTVTDMAPAEKLAESLAQLSDLPIRYRLGGHDEADLDGCDLLVVSPAVPKDRSDFIKAAVSRGIPLSAEMNLFVERCPARRIIGVTGSAGKSTTTAMIGSILEAARAKGFFPHAWMGGNIGHSLLGSLDQMTADDALVLELSSFQLEDLGVLRWSPPVAVITNIQPNHLDRHGTMDAYAGAKMNLVRYQKHDDVIFVHAGDTAVHDRLRQIDADARMRVCEFEPFFEAFLKLPGGHNRVNAAAAIAATRAVGVDDRTIGEGLASFHGLPHRLEFVVERDGVKYYNDSKSTTPESTQIAAQAFDASPVILLVGGKPKGASFADLGRRLAKICKSTICYGMAGPEIYKEVIATSIGAEPPPAHLVASFAEAVSLSRRLARPGDVVVLSPACASYDEFTNYEERGAAFRRLVSE